MFPPVLKAVEKLRNSTFCWHRSVCIETDKAYSNWKQVREQVLLLHPAQGEVSVKIKKMLFYQVATIDLLKTVSWPYKCSSVKGKLGSNKAFSYNWSLTAFAANWTVNGLQVCGVRWFQLYHYRETSSVAWHNCYLESCHDCALS